MNEDSLFYYKKGLSYQNYTHPKFQPIFLDEVDKNKLENAKTKCGSNSSQACIFDYLATGDIALALSSGIEEASAQSDKTIVGWLGLLALIHDNILFFCLFQRKLK